MAATISELFQAISDHRSQTEASLNTINTAHNNRFAAMSKVIESNHTQIVAIKAALSQLPPPTLNIHFGALGGLTIMQAENMANKYNILNAIPVSLPRERTWSEMTLVLPQVIRANVSYYDNTITSTQWAQIVTDFNAGKRTMFTTPSLIITAESVMRSTLIDILGQGDALMKTNQSQSIGVVTQTAYTDVTAFIDLSVLQAVTVFAMGAYGVALDVLANAAEKVKDISNWLGILVPKKFTIQPFIAKDSGDYVSFIWQSMGTPFGLFDATLTYASGLSFQHLNKFITYSQPALARYYTSGWSYDVWNHLPTAQIMTTYFNGIDPFIFALTFNDVPGAKSISVNDQIIAYKDPTSGLWETLTGPVQVLPTTSTVTLI
jgi:hypothetical protein